MATPRIYDMLPKPKKRPESSLAEPELRALELYLFTNMTFTDIYKMVFDMRDKSYATVRTAAKSLLDSADAEVYLTERYREINAFINTGESEDDDVGVSVINEDGTYSEEFILTAKKKIARLALKENDGNRFLEKFQDLIGKQESMRTASLLPQRYLAEQCQTCRYKAIFEEDFQDDCNRCRWKLDAPEKYDHKTQFITKPEE